MAVTPFIKPITTDKGIFYTFQSAIDDITTTFSHDNRKFKFSKFALLRIPEMGVPSSLLTDNRMQFLAVGERPLIDGINSSNYNINLAESFENYVLNLEALLLSNPDFNNSLRRTVAERVFFKWLKETGSIRWRNANVVNERDSSVIATSTFVEEDSISSTYNKVVKYIGEIDAVNSVSGDTSYTEVYIYIPTTVGNTPVVMFQSLSDNNYKEDMRIQNLAAAPLDVDYLAGRHYNDVHPSGLSTKAFYDLCDGSVTTEISDIVGTSPVYVERNWFNDTTDKSYYTDVTGNFNIAKNELILKNLGAKSVNYIRNTLDGVSIDFDLTHYKLVNETPDVHTFVQFAEMVPNSSANFDFNVILVYYDILDLTTTQDETALPISNLYGIFFLNQCKDMGAGLNFVIPTIPKYKPDPITKINGNSFGYKVNIKFDSAINQASVDKSINDYNTYSMDLFMDVLNAMTKLSNNYDANLEFIVNTKSEIDELKGLMVTSENTTEINQRLDNIETSLIQSQALFDNTSAISKQIQDLYAKYNNILNNKTTVNSSVYFDSATLNSMIVRNQEYDLSTVFKGNILDTLTLPLVKYTNFFKHYYTSTITVGKDLIVKIDDTNIKWENAQVFRLVFDSEIDLDIFNLKIYTDATGKYTGTIYGREVFVTNKADFFASGNKPIYEIMCTDKTALTFEVTKIR